MKLYINSRYDDPRAQMSSLIMEATLSKRNKRSSDVCGGFVLYFRTYALMIGSREPITGD